MGELIKKHTLTVIILGATLILAGIGIFTAIRLYQLRNQAVAPNVPSSKPAAKDINPDLPDPQCTLTFELGVIPTPSFVCTGKSAYYPDANGDFSRARPIIDNSTIAEGTVFYYEIAYTNGGTIPISSFVITDTLSNKLDYISTLQPSECVFTLSQRQFKCIFSTTIDPGDGGSVVLKVKTKTNISGDIANNAIINYGGFVPTNCSINLTVSTSTPTATPTESPTATPTSTPTTTPIGCNETCTSNSDCTGSMTCSGGRCRNVSCTGESDCVCTTPTPTSTSTTTPTPGGGTTTTTTQPSLPDAGISTPTVIGGFAGILLLMGALLLAL